MSTFRVGERAIFIGGKKEFEVTIQDRLQLCRDPWGKIWYGYPTDHFYAKSGRELQLSPRPHDLRKKSNDSDGLRASDSTKLGSWDKVGWSPVKSPAMEKNNV